jgi:hypothetical protein
VISRLSTRPIRAVSSSRVRWKGSLASVRARFVPGTHLIRYGEGDWNDSLQPVDPRMRDWMLSSWTVAMQLLPTIMPQVPIGGGSNSLILASKEAGGSIPAAPASSSAFGPSPPWAPAALVRTYRTVVAASRPSTDGDGVEFQRVKPRNYGVASENKTCIRRMTR